MRRVRHMPGPEEPRHAARGDANAPTRPPSAVQPAGEAERTYLELGERGALRAVPFPPDARVRVIRCAPCSVATYRALYAAVGGAWHWRDRLAWTDDALAAWLARPAVAVWVLEHRPDAPAPGGAPTWAPGGYYELVRQPDGAVELQYFGLIAALHGRRLGGALLTHAVHEAWRLGATRVQLNTCTLDGPAALPNYLARGFRITRTERYRVDDPP